MNLAKTFLSIGIAVIFTIFIVYGLYVVYESPKADCHTDIERESENQACLADYRVARHVWEINSVIILAGIGLAAILIGFLLLSAESIGSGILGGGILLIIYNVFRYWGALNKFLRLGVLGAALIILIFFGYKMLEKKPQSS